MKTAFITGGATSIGAATIHNFELAIAHGGNLADMANAEMALRKLP